ncbi:hypothetical protein [Hafnia phage yong3]|nr:hypothetical protein [Hafnia phage yong3]
METKYTLALLSQAVATYKGSEYPVEPHFNIHNDCINDVLVITTNIETYNEDPFHMETIYFNEAAQTVSFKYGDYMGCVHDITLPLTDTTLLLLNQLCERLSN